jgi:Ca-activated chloride channel family protein
MLDVTITPHREFLTADRAEQTLFVMLKLRPTREVSASRPPITFIPIVDTSGSMYEETSCGKTKLDIVIESLEQLVKTQQTDPRDRIAIIQFDDTASVLLPPTSTHETQAIQQAINRLRDSSGGTHLAKGMRKALELLENCELSSRRILIFTDGETFDEIDCRELSIKFAKAGIPITALGVGDYNEDLLIQLSDRTGGQVLNIVETTQSNGTGDVPITELPAVIFQQIQQSQAEVINNLKLSLQTVKGVTLRRLCRVYPDRVDFPLDTTPYPISSALAHDDTVFILEFNVDSRAGSRVRIAQLGLTYDTPGQQRRGELPPQNLIVQFVAGQDSVAQTNPEVMGYVQQCNITNLIDQAADIADQDPDRAQQLLETAKRITEKIGNDSILQALNQTISEVRHTRKISPGARKTIKMSAKGKTVKMSGSPDEQLFEGNIRDLTGA